MLKALQAVVFKSIKVFLNTVVSHLTIILTVYNVLDVASISEYWWAPGDCTEYLQRPVLW